MNKFRLRFLNSLHWRLHQIGIAVDHTLETAQSKSDEQKLTKENKHVTDRNKIAECIKELKPSYQEYIQNVSVENHAVSLEQAAFLLNYCHVTRPTKLIDFGSGFSSYVLRSYAKENNAEVYSVDDDAAWLQKTVVFLQSKILAASHVLQATDFFNAVPPINFDLIYYDLGNMETRRRHLHDIMQLFSKNAAASLIIDDVHKDDYRKYVLSTLRQESFPYYNLKELTIDTLGRYAYLVYHQRS